MVSCVYADFSCVDTGLERWHHFPFHKERYCYNWEEIAKGTGHALILV